MSKYSIEKETLDAIADAILAQTGGTAALSPTAMPDAIAAISGENLDTEITEQSALIEQIKAALEEKASGESAPTNDAVARALLLNQSNALAFYGKTLPEEISGELQVELPYAQKNMDNFLALTNFASGLIKVYIKANNTITSMYRSFYQSCYVTEITLDFDTSAVTTYKTCFNMANTNNAVNLKTINGILDFSSATNILFMFDRCYALVDVTFAEETLALSLSMSACLNLSDTSIESILNSLATVETAHTLTLHADVGAKLAEEQIAAATAKNWTIAY